MELLERSHELSEMSAALAAAGQGHGSVVLITGDAGIGKTRLADEFVQSVSKTARIVWGPAMTSTLHECLAHSATLHTRSEERLGSN